MSDTTKRGQRRREWLWSMERMRRCCWCLDPTVLERLPSGQPMELTATLEHPRSRNHPNGRARLRETRLSHHACNLTVNRIEIRAAVAAPQSSRDLEWLARVAAIHEADGVPGMRKVIAHLLELAADSVVGQGPHQDVGREVPAGLFVGRPEEGW